MTSNYELSILCRMDSFVYMATDNRRRVLLLRDYRLDTPFHKINQRSEELRHTFARDANLQSPYRNIRIGVVTTRHTLIPNRLYNPQEKMAYMRQLTSLADEWEVKSDDLNGIAAQNVYGYPKPLMDVFRERFTGARICHCGSAFLLAHYALSDFQEGQQIFVNAWSNQLQIILYEDGELQFINAYPYQSAKDFIYFVMLVFDQYDLDRQRVPVQLVGQIAEGSETFRLLLRYVNEVNMLRAPSFVQLGKEYGQVPEHLYYDLFCLVQCN